MDTETARLARNLTLLKWMRIDPAFFAAAVIVAFEIHAVGLTLTQVLLGESIFAFTILALEVPTGVFSDLVSRKKTLLLAELLLVIGVPLLAFSQNFFHIIIAQIMWGAAAALISGTDSAMLFDTLKALGREEEHKAILGKITSFYLFTLAIGMIVGGFLVEVNWRLPVLLSAPLPFIKLILIAFLKEPPREKPKHQAHPLQHTWSAIRWLFSHQALLLLIIATMFVGLGRKISLHTYNPYMELIETPVVYWGILLAAFSLIASALSKHAHTIQQYLGERLSFFVMYGLWIMGFILMAKAHIALAFLFPLIHQLLIPFQDIFFSDEINKRTTSDRRATVLSIGSSCRQSLQMLVLPFLGYVADAYSLETMYLLVAGVLAVAGMTTGLGLLREWKNFSLKG